MLRNEGGWQIGLWIWICKCPGQKQKACPGLWQDWKLRMKKRYHLVIVRGVLKEQATLCREFWGPWSSSRVGLVFTCSASGNGIRSILAKHWSHHVLKLHGQGSPVNLRHISGPDYTVSCITTQLEFMIWTFFELLWFPVKLSAGTFCWNSWHP